MKRIAQSLLLWILTCLASSALASEQILLHHINTKGYAVRMVHRDVNGIVWLGTTSGLLSLPQLESRNPSGYHRNLGHANMSIKRISGDSQGRMWIKSIYNENYLYNPLRNELVEDTPTMLAGKGIDVTSEFTVQTDKDDRLWIWKDNRLYCLEKEADQAELISLDSEERLQNVYVKGKLLAAITQKTFYWISTEKKQIMQSLPLPPGVNLRDHLFISNDDTVWIWGSNKVWRNEGDQWVCMLQTASDVTTIAQDDESRLWISSQSDGIYICDHQCQLITRLQNTPGDNYSLQNNQISGISYEPAGQAMWIFYTKGGLSVYSKKDNNLLLHVINDPTDAGAFTDVLAFVPDKDRRSMWMALEDRGVWRVDEQGYKNEISGGSAVALHASGNGDLWAGIYRQGLVRKSANGQEKCYLEGSSPFAIAEDEHGHIFTALLGMGVWELDPVTEEATDTELGSKYVFDLEFRQQNLYAAATEGLFVRGRNRTWELLHEGHYRYLDIDSQGNFWLIGNEGSEGLTLLSPDGQQIELPEDLKTAPLKSLTIDKNDAVWALTSTELLKLCYHPDEEEPLERYSFNISTGAQQAFYNLHTTFVDDNGILWLGATTGYQSIDTHSLTAQTQKMSEARQLALGAISINDNILSPGKAFNGRVLLDKDVIFTRQLELRYNENNIVIECSQSGNNGYSTDAYYYQVKGFSTNWYPIEGHAIILSNLPPGSYEILTRTQSTEAYELLTIHIAPPFWLSWWAFCLYVLFLAALIYGITRYYHNRRAYQLKLRKLELQQEQQAQINDMKQRFFTNISHDLRTPLSLIIGPVEELMRSEEVNKEQLQTSLSMVQRNAQHLLTLVNQILDFRRLEIGKEKLLLSYGDIVSQISNVCESFRLKAEKEHIRFAFIPSVERVETMLDRDKTTKIMMNLLSNAFKFTDAGGRITVRLDISDRQIVIAVEDTGTGISQEDKEHLFERFYQSDQNTRASMGSGIGLHIVREYVHLQGGEITVSDNEAEGQGSIFRFTLPLKKSETPHDDKTTEIKEEKIETPQEEREEEQEELSSEEQIPTLLIVDDNLDLLTYMSQSLHSSYEMLTATNGEEALRLLREKDVDLIISDVMMPVMDGLELCRRVKTEIETSHIPVVLLTAKAMTSDELKGLEAGADDYVTKPFSMDILRQRVHNLLERTRQHHERFAKEVDIEPSDITVTSLDEQFISHAIDIVEQHIAEPDFSVEQLSEEIGVHRAQLYKKLQNLTGKSPLQFIRILRLKRGKQLLEQSGMYVSEVAYKVGFNSPRLFAKYFKEEFGVTPKEFTKQE